MTRRRDLMCEDIFGCDHALTIPISENGTILYWRCVCGAKQQTGKFDTGDTYIEPVPPTERLPYEPPTLRQLSAEEVKARGLDKWQP